ncbi:Arm DNA-binding domain-containing protein [Polaromonas sp. P1(28)-13]|nr:Arm DNA-binding domain-containing protein [Polaromonas sp. P1(28)-13]
MSKLSVRRIDSEKPDSTKDRRIADGLGLYLKVATPGTKTFTYRYTYNTKRHELTLGVYPEMSLAQARQARLESSKILESGRNPIHVHQNAKEAKREALNVSELIEEFHLKYLKVHFEKPDDARKTLIRDIGSEIGKYLVPDVTKKTSLSPSARWCSAAPRCRRTVL